MSPIFVYVVYERPGSVYLAFRRRSLGARAFWTMKG